MVFQISLQDRRAALFQAEQNGLFLSLQGGQEDRFPSEPATLRCNLPSAEEDDYQLPGGKVVVLSVSGSQTARHMGRQVPSAGWLQFRWIGERSGSYRMIIWEGLEGKGPTGSFLFLRLVKCPSPKSAFDVILIPIAFFNVWLPLL